MSVVGEILLLEQASSPVTSDKAGYADADVVAYGIEVELAAETGFGKAGAFASGVAGVVVTGNVFLETGSGVIGRI